MEKIASFKPDFRERSERFFFFFSEILAQFLPPSQALLDGNSSKLLFLVEVASSTSDTVYKIKIPTCS